MEDITDAAFRSLCKEHGADVMFSEFIAADGIIRHVEKSLSKIHFTENERPFGIQVFGNNVNTLVEAVQVITRYKPDIIDLNFGCPVKKVVNKGGGAALLNNIPLMIQITEAVVKSTAIPVTVKTRLGWDQKTKNIVDVAERLQDAGIKALTIHARTKAQMYTGEADWTLLREVKNNHRMHIPIFGNGDINTPEKALDFKNKYGVDGIMIGRAALGNPWIFNRIKYFIHNNTHLKEAELSAKIQVCKEFIKHSVALNGTNKGLLKIRRHYSPFFSAIPHFKPYRLKLLTLNNVDEIMGVLDEIKNSFT